MTTPLPTMRDVPAAQCEPMPYEVFEIFVKAAVASMQGADKVVDASALFQEVGGEKAPPALAILVSRLQAGDGTLRFSMMTAIFLALISPSPGRAVLWAHYLVRRSYEINAVVDIDMLATDFPMGFPTDEGASRIWDAQKGPDGNRLDREAQAWRQPLREGNAATAAAGENQP